MSVEESLSPKSRPYESAIVSSLFLCATIALVVSITILYTLLNGTIDFFTSPSPNEDGEPAETSLSEFLFGSEWIPNGRFPKFGTLPLLAGTALIAGGSLLIAIPFGVSGALFLSEFSSKKFRKFVKPTIEILAGIPSIVYGYFALITISPFIQDTFDATYFNAASAILVVSVMVLPIILTISDDAISSVSNDLREASLALGATKWETSTKVVLPAASSGILASVLLAMGRAIGETMAVTMAAGQVANLGLDPFEQTQTMTSYIAMVATGDIPPGVAVDAGYAVGFYLFVLTYLVNLAAWSVVSRSLKNQPIWGKKTVSKLYSLTFGKISNFVSTSKMTLDRRYKIEKFGKGLLFLSLFYSLSMLVILLNTVISRGIEHVDYDFITSIPSRFEYKAGIYPALIGSVYLMLLTMLLVMPAGVGGAIYLVEFAKDTWHTRLLRRVIQNLAGVPSIIFGLVGLYIFSRTLGFGTSLLTGSLTLAIMTLPMVVVTTEEALQAVPKGFREASLAVGATKWQTVRYHVVPNSLAGITTGGILSLARAIGETAPILFVAGIFSKTTPDGVLDGFLALPMMIFYWTKQPSAEFKELAAATIIVLLALLLVLNLIAVSIRINAEKKRVW
ncbi:MAG: hypothetical protein CL734_06085 [Chloroflexi bacterium]|nr:hypothetical protein [Chloroflexota bacterium]